MTQLGEDVWDAEFRVRIERQLWALTQELLAQGQSVILEWGHRARAEQDEKRLGARALGVGVELHYLIFTEGSSASSGGDLIRFDLAGEAQRLARVLARLTPDEPEVHGLLALLELTAARFPPAPGRTASRCC